SESLLRAARTSAASSRIRSSVSGGGDTVSFGTPSTRWIFHWRGCNCREWVSRVSPSCNVRERSPSSSRPKPNTNQPSSVTRNTFCSRRTAVPGFACPTSSAPGAGSPRNDNSRDACATSGSRHSRLVIRRRVMDIQLLLVEDLLGILFPDTLAQEEFIQVRVNMVIVAHAFQDRQRLGDLHRVLVRTVLGGQRLEDIGNRHHPCRPGHLFPGQATREATAVHLLMVATGVLRHASQLARKG